MVLFVPRYYYTVKGIYAFEGILLAGMISAIAVKADFRSCGSVLPGDL